MSKKLHPARVKELVGDALDELFGDADASFRQPLLEHFHALSDEHLARALLPTLWEANTELLEACKATLDALEQERNEALIAYKAQRTSYRLGRYRGYRNALCLCALIRSAIAVAEEGKKAEALDENAAGQIPQEAYTKRVKEEMGLPEGGIEDSLWDEL